MFNLQKEKEMINHLNLNPQEAEFVKRIQQPFAMLIKSNPQLEVDFLRKTLEQFQQGIISTQARKVVEGILYKISMSLIEYEVEEMLSDDSYGQLPPTPDLSQSTIQMSHTKSQSRANLTAQLILNTLRTIPDVIKSSRTDIAHLTGLRIQTVTGAITPLIKEGKITITGTKYDLLSERLVQTLKATT